MMQPWEDQLWNTANRWGHFFQYLGPPFPGPEATDHDWQDFLRGVSWWPEVLLFTAVLAVLAVLLVDCCCGCGTRWPPRVVLFQKPRIVSLFALVLLTLSVIAVGSLVSWRSGI